MYYRVAIQADSSSILEWKSSVLSELSALFQWLRLHQALRYDRLRLFSCSSREELIDQLMQENEGLGYTSVTAAQFLEKRGISSPKMRQGTLEHSARGEEAMASTTVTTIPSLNEISREAHALPMQGMSALERRRVELEFGTADDHDVPYTFALPASWPAVLAWMKLLTKVHAHELQP